MHKARKSPPVAPVDPDAMPTVRYALFRASSMASLSALKIVSSPFSSSFALFLMLYVSRFSGQRFKWSERIRSLIFLLGCAGGLGFPDITQTPPVVCGACWEAFTVS